MFVKQKLRFVWRTFDFVCTEDAAGYLEHSPDNLGNGASGAFEQANLGCAAAMVVKAWVTAGY